MVKRDKFQRFAILAVISFFVVLLGLTVAITVKNNSDSRKILEDSVKSRTVAISIAALELIDTDKFKDLLEPGFLNTYNNPYSDGSNALFAQYKATLGALRTLKDDVDATYIYILWKYEGKLYFIFDTDESNDDWIYDGAKWIYAGEDTDVGENDIPTPFTWYEDADDVHFQPFTTCKPAASIISDSWGDFVTGVVPVLDGDKVIGVVCTDIEDSFIRANIKAANVNLIILIVALAVTMAAMALIVYFLLRSIKKMQDKLFRMANYDVVTGLPNRQYLLDNLQKITEKNEKSKDKQAFALIFVDLDNFKKVNDSAGHDAGDELLRAIADYLDNALYKSKSFRPAAGILNVSARIGGDEFLQIAADVRNEEQASLVARKLLDNFTAQAEHISPYIKQFSVGLSIGISLYPVHSQDYNMLIKYADIAMYHAKKNGKHNYCIYNENMQPKEEK